MSSASQALLSEFPAVKLLQGSYTTEAGLRTALADQDVVYVNYSTGSLFLEKPEEVERSALIFNHLRAAALSISQSREMVSRTQQELT